MKPQLMLYIISILPLTVSSYAATTSRMSSAPYISGDSFRAISDHLFDETNTSFDPNIVQNGDIIFVKTDYLDLFFKTKHPRIKARYILITHNSDHPAPDQYLQYLNDDKIIVWFGQNPTIQHHTKFKPIPIGIANQYWHHGSVSTFNKIISHGNPPKQYLLGINFRPTTCISARSHLYTYFNTQAFSTNIESNDHMNYLYNMQITKFILSPRGNGLDCHRTWEALLVGSIPILQHSELDELLEDLPVLIIDSWYQLSSEYLEKEYKKITSSPFIQEKMYFNYWKNLIYSYKKNLSKKGP